MSRKQMPRNIMLAGLIGAFLLVGWGLTTSASAQLPAVTREVTEPLVDQALLGARPRTCGALTTVTDETLAICRGIDLARVVIRTSPTTSFAYSENDAFDVQLRASLNRSQNRVISVSFPSESDKLVSRQEIELFEDVRPDTPRIMVWLNKVKTYGGSVNFCHRGTDGNLQGINVITAIINAFFNWLDRWTLYQPAKKFHARVITVAVPGSSLVRVETVQFVRRTRQNTPLTCSTAVR